MGCLTAEVLSAYDLPYSEAPQCVTLTTSDVTLGGSPSITLKTGPPLARHKDRNSFRFSTPTSFDGASTGSTTIVRGNTQAPASSASTMELIAPLPDLYKARITIRIVYANREPLETVYDLQQLKIRESKWLILNLAPASPGALVATDDNAWTTVHNNNFNSKASPVTDPVAPTIRVKLILEGPYRPEIAALVAITQSWFAGVDVMEQRLQHLWSRLPIVSVPVDLSKAMVLPAVPLLAIIVVASPVIAGIAMVALPFVLPIVLLLITGAVTLLLSSGVMAASTRWGRDHLGTTLAPLTDSLLSSRAGQALIYDMGPRPSPVSLAKQVLPTSLYGKLVVSLLVDLVGSSSYLLPVVGEGFDLVWAPLQTILIMAMYDTVTPNLKYVSFFEEILPFTDIVPTATIGFLCEFAPQILHPPSSSPLSPPTGSTTTGKQGNNLAPLATKVE